MQLNMGSNVIRNTNGVLVVHGKEQIALEVGEDGQVLLTMDIFDAGGDHVAKLNRNAWVFNNDDRYDITTNPESLRLIEKESSDVVIEVNVVSRTTLAIPRAAFYTPQGVPITVTPEVLRIGPIRMSDNSLDGNGTAFAIT